MHGPLDFITEFPPSTLPKVDFSLKPYLFIEFFFNCLPKNNKYLSKSLFGPKTKKMVENKATFDRFFYRVLFRLFRAIICAFLGDVCYFVGKNSTSGKFLAEKV